MEKKNKSVKKNIPMDKKSGSNSRRVFLKQAGAALVATILPYGFAGAAFKQGSLSVWSCGGLAEAFILANQFYKDKTGIDINYTGAFAGALGKSLLGSAQTEVFAGRVLELARKLRAADKMVYFKPLCFTEYVMVTPKGNPAGIESIKDIARKGVRVVLSPDASPPGGKAVTGLLKKAGVVKQAFKNAVVRGTCVQTSMDYIISGKGDVSVVEKRLTRMPRFLDKTEILPIEEKFFPIPPLTFTIGVMKFAKDQELADHYVNFILSEKGQSFFDKQGFIPAISEKGQRLIKKLGVYDETD